MGKMRFTVGVLCALAFFCAGQAAMATNTYQFAEFTTKNLLTLSETATSMTITGSFDGASGSNFQYDVPSGYNPAAPGSNIAGTFSLTASIGQIWSSAGQTSASNIVFNILDSQSKNLLTINGAGIFTDTRDSAGNGTVSLSAQNFSGTHSSSNTVSYTSSFLQFGSNPNSNYTLDLNMSQGGTITGKFSSDSVKPVPEPAFFQLGTLLICSGGLAAFRLRRA